MHAALRAIDLSFGKMFFFFIMIYDSILLLKTVNIVHSVNLIINSHLPISKANKSKISSFRLNLNGKKDHNFVKSNKISKIGLLFENWIAFIEFKIDLNSFDICGQII